MRLRRAAGAQLARYAGPALSQRGWTCLRCDEAPAADDWLDAEPVTERMTLPGLGSVEDTRPATEPHRRAARRPDVAPGRSRYRFGGQRGAVDADALCGLAAVAIACLLGLAGVAVHRHLQRIDEIELRARNAESLALQCREHVQALERAGR